MITARFALCGGSPAAVEVTGHAGFGPNGADIVCASVTSAVQLTANAVTEILRAPASVEVGENRIRIALHGCSGPACDFLRALRLHLELLGDDYPDHITVTVTEE